MPTVADWIQGIQDITKILQKIASSRGLREAAIVDFSNEILGDKFGHYAITPGEWDNLSDDEKAVTFSSLVSISQCFRDEPDFINKHMEIKHIQEAFRAK